MGRLYLLSGDYILNLKGKYAIVNAANKYMFYGSGICGVVYRNAGIKQLENYCKKTFNIDMKTSEVRITPGFNLNMDIIYVLAPKYYEKVEPIVPLIKAYKNMLDEILKNKYKNVLVCSIGTGIYGYKHEDVAKQHIFLLNNFCKINDVNLYLNNIYPAYKDIYLKEYLNENNLVENDIKRKYHNFVNDKDLEELCLSEKIICLQYTLENFDVTKKQMAILIDSIGDNYE